MLKHESLPFNMRVIDTTPMEARGYNPHPIEWTYDPVSQTSDLIRMGGSSEPTTVSNCAETTGSWMSGYDNDTSADDTGND